MSELERDDSKEARGVLRAALVGAGTTANYNHARLRALRDADSLAPETGFAWVQAGPAGVTPDPAELFFMGPLPRAGMVQDVWWGVLNYFLATSQGGLWRVGTVANLGAPFDTWFPLGDQLPSLAVNTVAGISGQGTVPDTLLVGTGDAYHVGTEYAPWFGLFRSVDQGLTFHPLDGGPGVSRFFADDVNEILLVDSARWLVATRTGLYWTIDSGRNFGNNLAVDNGEPLDTGNILDVRGIATGLPAGIDLRVTYSVSGEGLRRFDIPDSGLPARMTVGRHSWERRVGIRRVGWRLVAAGDIAFDHAVVDRQDLLALSVAAADQGPGVHNALEVGTGALTGLGSWDQLPTDGITTPGSRAQTDYDHVVLLDPSWHTAASRGFLWVGSVDLLTGKLGAGGAFVPSGSKLASVAQNTLHADQHVLIPDTFPGDAVDGVQITSVVVGNDGGVFMNDGAGSRPWTGLGSAPTALFYHLAAATLGDRIAIAGGLQDNGSVVGIATTVIGGSPVDPTGPASWSWRGTGGGDGGASLLCNTAGTNDLVAFAVANDNLVRWVHDATTGVWSQDPPVGTGNRGQLVEPPSDVNFTATLARGQDAGGAWNTVFLGLWKDAYGGAILYRCTSALGPLVPVGVSGSTPSFQRMRHSEFDRSITAMLAVPDPASPGAWTGLWLGHGDGKLRYSGNATANRPTWTEATPPGNERPIGGIAVDPLNSQVIAVTTTGFADRPSRYKTGRVFLGTRAANGTVAWLDISGTDDSDGTNLPDVPAYGITITATAPRRIVVGTEIGVFCTSDDGRTWKRLDLALALTGTARSFSRLPRVPVYSVASPDPPIAAAAGPMPRLIAGTYGRSAWILQDLAQVADTGARGAVAALHVEVDGGFGYVHTGGSVTRPLTLTNRGAAPAEIQAIEVDGTVFSVGGSPPPPTLAGPPVVLAVGDRLTFTVTCAPIVSQIARATLTVRTAIPHQPTIELPLSADGVGDAVGRLGVFPTTEIAFGELEASHFPRTAPLVLRNVGTGPLTITSMTASASNPSHGGIEVLDAPTGPIAPGEEHVCRVRLHLSTADEWPRVEETVTIVASVGPQHVVRVSGGKGVPVWFRVVEVVFGVAFAAAATAFVVVAAEGSQRP